MRTLKVFFVTVLLLCAFSNYAFAQEKSFDEYYEEQYESSGAEKLKQALPKDVEKLMDSVGISDVDFYTIFKASPEKLLKLFLEIACGNIDAPLKGIVKVIGVILLSAVVRSMFPSDNKMENVLNIVTGSAIAICFFTPLTDVIVRGVTVISSSADFMFILIPVLTGVITAGGNPALALSYNSFTFAAAQAVSRLSDSVILPLSGIFTATGVISSVSQELKINGLGELIKKSVFGTLSFTATMFSAILSLKGIMAGSADSLASRGIKLVVGSTIPIIGGAVSEAYSSIVGSLSLIKNAVGMFGIIAVAIINLPVMAELLFWIFGFKLSAVFSSLLGDEKSCELIKVISSALTIINAMILFEVVIFIISAAIILSLRTSI